MRKIQRILVAVKSPGERWSAAVAKATQIARATGTRLELFHGIDTRLYVEALDTYEGGLSGFESLLLVFAFAQPAIAGTLESVETTAEELQFEFALRVCAPGFAREFTGEAPA
jgi:hypothetical protein